MVSWQLKISGSLSGGRKLVIRAVKEYSKLVSNKVKQLRQTRLRTDYNLYVYDKFDIKNIN